MNRFIKSFQCIVRHFKQYEEKIGQLQAKQDINSIPLDMND